MITQSPPTTNASASPWQERQLGYGLKLLVMFGSVLLAMIALGSGITLFMVLISTATIGTRWTGDFWADVFPFILALGVLLVSGFGVIKLYPYVSAPSRFTPSYGQVPPTFTGQPFEVRFLRPRLSRSFRGKGTLRFDADHLVLDGMLMPSALFQIGVLVVVTLAPMLLLGVGLGIIPALLIALVLGRKKLSRSVPYASMSDLMVQGCRVSFSASGDAPNKVALYVSQQDGERLYRELAQRFPAALSGWIG